MFVPMWIHKCALTRFEVIFACLVLRVNAGFCGVIEHVDITLDFVNEYIWRHMLSCIEIYESIYGKT